MSKIIGIFKENPLMSLAALTIMLITSLLFYYIWNRKTLVEKLAIEEGIKLRITKAKGLKEQASSLPGFIKKPIDYCSSWVDYFFPDTDTLKPYPPTSGESLNVAKGSSHSSSSEEKCREIVERLFNKKFASVRPSWLKNPMSNRNLELDMYNEELKLAFEYDGVQHRQYTARWHSSQDDFDEQIMRDKIKNKLCRQNEVLLIRVPDNCGDMEKFIKKECISKGILDP
jgi:hypothetical protein